MKKLLILLLMIFSIDSFATGIGAGTSASCDNATLDKYTGTVNAEIDWEPNTIQLNWYSDDEKLTVATASQSCTYNGMITVPPQPTKPGYTFNGWKIKKIMVPSGYTQLEYIKPDGGGQYIDTGISPHSENIVYKASWLETTLESWASLFGNTNTAYDNGRWPGTFFHPRQGVTYLAIAASDHMCQQSNIVANRVNTVEIIVKNGVLTKIQNGTSCTARYDGTVQAGVNITLFADYFATFNDREYCKYTQLFYWQMWDNGVLVRDMIPARRNSDNVLGMWDTVSKTFFTNAGTGSFIAGPAVTE